MAEEIEREVNYTADHWVSRYEIESRQRYERELDAQRLEIATLKAEKISDAKDIELYKQFRRDLKDAIDPIKDDIEHLKCKTHEQDVWNTAQQAAMHRMSDDIADLMHLTRRRIPRYYITPPIEDAPEP